MRTTEWLRARCRFSPLDELFHLAKAAAPSEVWGKSPRCHGEAAAAPSRGPRRSPGTMATSGMPPMRMNTTAQTSHPATGPPPSGVVNFDYIRNKFWLLRAG